MSMLKNILSNEIAFFTFSMIIMFSLITIIILIKEHYDNKHHHSTPEND